MRSINDLTLEELAQIVGQVQSILWLDWRTKPSADGSGRTETIEFLNPAIEWTGASEEAGSVVVRIVDVFEDAGLAPDAEVVVRVE
jgi:hypothetical protein